MVKNPVPIELTNNKLVAISLPNLQETDQGKGPAKQPRIVLSIIIKKILQLRILMWKEI